MATNQEPIRTPQRPKGSMPDAQIPDPPTTSPAPAEQGAGQAPAPAAPAALLTLTSIHERLCKPFSLSVVDVKPGAVTKDRSRALALAYVDPRAYQTRLDRLAGPEGWSVRYQPAGDGRSIICSLTILGVTKEDVGECDAGDENQATSAAMQAFKRACAAFGLGRYLYALPQPWVDYDGDRKMIADPAGAARRIYDLAGLLQNGSKE